MDLRGLRPSPFGLPAHLHPPCRSQYTPTRTHSLRPDQIRSGGGGGNRTRVQNVSSLPELQPCAQYETAKRFFQEKETNPTPLVNPGVQDSSRSGGAGQIRGRGIGGVWVGYHDAQYARRSGNPGSRHFAQPGPTCSTGAVHCASTPVRVPPTVIQFQWECHDFASS